MDKAEQRRWMYCRWMYRLGLYVLVSPFALYFGPNLFILGKLIRPSPRDYAQTAQMQCMPTVRAIKEYLEDDGRLPRGLGDLVPGYMASVPARQTLAGQQFEFSESDGFDVDDSTRIIYKFSPRYEGWYVDGPYVSGPIPLPLVYAGTRN